MAQFLLIWTATPIVPSSIPGERSRLYSITFPPLYTDLKKKTVDVNDLDVNATLNNKKKLSYYVSVYIVEQLV